MGRLAIHHFIVARLRSCVEIRGRAWLREITPSLGWLLGEGGARGGQLRLRKECKKLRGLKNTTDHGGGVEDCSRT